MLKNEVESYLRIEGRGLKNLTRSKQIKLLLRSHSKFVNSVSRSWSEC
jgi:hypothetical protein